MKNTANKLWQVNWHYRGDKLEDSFIERIEAPFKKDLPKVIADSVKADPHDIIVYDAWKLI